MKKILSAALLLVLLFTLGAHKSKNTEEEVRIAGLLSLTGEWSSLGITSREAVNIAIQEVNARMKQTGSPYRFSVVFYDTKLNPGTALEAIKEAHKNNMRYVVGPQSSAELQSIASYANENNILTVSHGSTAGNMAISGDAIFRFCPTEEAECDAMAQSIYGAGHRTLITLSSDDAGNKGLQQAIGNAFTKRGGTVEALPPFPSRTSNFSQLLSNLKVKILQKSKVTGPKKIAVYLSSFDEVKDLFHQAAKDPLFRSVRWYGGDAIALSNALLSDAIASSFAVAVRFYAPSFGFPSQSHPDLEKLLMDIKTATGTDADAYTLAAYDAVWVIARSISSFHTPPPDFEVFKKIFRLESSQYSGITGPTFLNAAGDRSTGSFDYWGIIKEGSTYGWGKVGK